jgi:NAD+ kinase
LNRPHVIVVGKRTAYRRFVEDEGDPRARNLIKKRDPSVASWLASHKEHSRTMDEVARVLDRVGAKALFLQRAHAAFDTSDAALVIAVGGDGTLLAASHNVGSVPVLGVNSAPSHSVGFFCAAQRSDFESHLTRALDGKLKSMLLTRMTVSLNGRMRSKRVLNEALYCHSGPAATSRYILHVGKQKEEQRSSGIWIGPAAGSTAAQRSAGGRILPLTSDELQLVVREPYSPYGKFKLLKLVVGPSSHVSVQSKMDDAALFLDGPHRTVSVQLGDVVSFGVSDEPLNVLGLRGRKPRRWAQKS